MERYLIICFLCFGCGSQTSAPTGEDTSIVDTATDTQTAPPADTQPEPDSVSADSAPGTDISPDTTADVKLPDIPTGPSDGLLGAKCSDTSDCAAAPEHICFAGFCTRRCYEDGSRIADACAEASSQSMFGGTWGCPSDIAFCMPGAVEEQPIVCSFEGQCLGFGPEFHCTAAVLISKKIVDGICLPSGNERLAAGSDCYKDYDCQSLFCLGEDPENGTAGVCTPHCKTNAHCQPGELCVGVGFQSQEDSTEATAWAGMCRAQSGSLKYCTAQSQCPEGDVCEVFIEPSSLKKQTWCVGEDAGTKQVGDPCDKAADCASGRCMFGTTEEASGYCTNVCQKSPDDCPESMSCGHLSLHNNGTPGDYTDDVTYGLCVTGGSGDSCSINAAKWCDEPLECNALGGTPEWLGTCEQPLGCSDPNGPVCSDALSCTVDKCEDNICDYSTLENGTCLIAGDCYSDGDASPSNPCQQCDAATSKNGWTAAPDSDTCQDGEPVVVEPEPDTQAPQDISEPEDAGPEPDTNEAADTTPSDVGEPTDAPSDTETNDTSQSEVDVP